MGWSLALSFTNDKAFVAGSIKRRSSAGLDSSGAGAEYATLRNETDFGDFDRIGDPPLLIFLRFEARLRQRLPF
jgi:hypothetical protein